MLKRILYLLLLIISHSAIAQVNLSQGLVAHYPFAGSANDASGNNIHGTVNNATLTTDRLGQANSAYYFNGTNASISLPFSNLYNFAPADDFSICLWVSPDATGFYPYRALVVKSPYDPVFTNSDWNYGIYLDNNRMMTGYDGNNFLYATTTIPANQCWYHLALVYNNGIWKVYVNGVLEASDNSQTKRILQDGFSAIAFGKKGEADGDWYQGKMDEVRIYDRELTSEELYMLSQPAILDFYYRLDPCDPLTVQFYSTGNINSNPYWSFGDGTTLSGNPAPVHTFSSPGIYTIKYMAGDGSCLDTVRKTLNLSIAPDDIVLTRDTIICPGNISLPLATQPALNFCWSPDTYLNDPSLPNPVASPPSSITYNFTAQVPGNNIVTNGDFTAGNTGFTSGYIYAPVNTTNGEYFVGTNPSGWNPVFSPCTDHTSGAGNMLLVNGHGTSSVRVWSQVVPVIPNTNYVFGGWAQSINNNNNMPFSVMLTINRNIGGYYPMVQPGCNWQRFHITWNSGNNTSATLSILSLNTQDLAFDDIFFAPLLLKRDSIRITIDSPLVRTNNDTSICAGKQVQLLATGANSYSWSPATGLNDPTIANPVATPLVTTQYIVTGTVASGCAAKDTITIAVNPNPVISITNDTTICDNASVQLQATGGSSYSWSPAATLDNPSVSNPVATPAATTTTYYVTVTNANSCTNNDSVTVTMRPAPVFSVNPDDSICANESKQLLASGGDRYLWSPSSLDDAAIANPVATPAVTTLYSVDITDTVCNNSATLSTTVTVLTTPVVQASKSNDIDCSNASSQLNATGATQYSWLPAANLDNPNIANPVATPLVSTVYTVTGTNAAGCFNSDTITVNVLATNGGNYLMPAAFTPNNDGLNDCYGIKYWGVITELQFSIYNRWGERVFYTTDPSRCWDGRYKSTKQDTGVFVYVINAKTSCSGLVSRKATFLLIR